MCQQNYAMQGAIYACYWPDQIRLSSTATGYISVRKSFLLYHQPLRVPFLENSVHVVVSISGTWNKTRFRSQTQPFNDKEGDQVSPPIPWERSRWLAPAQLQPFLPLVVPSITRENFEHRAPTTMERHRLSRDPLEWRIVR